MKRSTLLTDRDLVCGIVGVLLVAAIGVSLALQGWRARTPNVDLLADMENAYHFVTQGEIPERGVVNGYSSSNPTT